MEVRPIDANAMVNELRPVGFEAGHSVVLLSDVSKMMREWVERQPTLTQPNEPLTLEQLRQMDGEPVYIPETNCWVLVTQNPFVPLFTWPDGEQCSAYDWYEQVGPVYLCPQEKSTNE